MDSQDRTVSMVALCNPTCFDNLAKATADYFIPISVTNINTRIKQHTVNMHICDLQDEYNFSYGSVEELSEVG